MAGILSRSSFWLQNYAVSLIVIIAHLYLVCVLAWAMLTRCYAAVNVMQPCEKALHTHRGRLRARNQRELVECGSKCAHTPYASVCACVCEHQLSP